MLVAKDYEILRDIEANGRVRIPMERKPVRVATLLDERKFLEKGGALIHLETVFLEDRIHDWDHFKGAFSYYTRIATRADVVVVYELAPKEPK